MDIGGSSTLFATAGHSRTSGSVVIDRIKGGSVDTIVTTAYVSIEAYDRYDIS